MIRSIVATSIVLLFAAAAQAHFLYIVPEVGSDNEALVVLSEDIFPDEEIPTRIYSNVQLQSRDAQGDVQPLALREQEHAFAVTVPGEGTRVIFGKLAFGVRKHEDQAYLLTYFPKTVIGDAFDASTQVGGDVPVEIIAVGKAGAVRLQVLGDGKPKAGAEITVLLPDGETLEVTTDDQGMTPAYEQQGTYGAWARHVTPGAGEHDGEAYNEARSYATYVATIGEEKVAEPQAEAEPEMPMIGAEVTQDFAPLPEAVASFGAVEANGYLYVYGGHVARTHRYDVEAVSGQFHRMALDPGRTWEDLPPGPALQGMNLAAHNGMVYRVGGMQPRNPRGEDSDNHSVADCTRFNPSTMQWEWLPPMPSGRSSHDVAVVGNKLYVIGGWNMLGRIDGNDWLDHMCVLDLASPRPTWKKVAQPFMRRALIVAVHNEKIYVVGGMDDSDDISREVDIYDPALDQWSKGPQIPDVSRHGGFAPAACTLDGKLYISLAGGDMFRLTEPGDVWEKITETTPRIVHRLAPWQGRILVIGGADRGGNMDLIEAVAPADGRDAAQARSAY